MSAAKTYCDKWKCPKGHKAVIERRTSSAGRKVATFCQVCGRMYSVLAAPVPAPKGETP